MTDQSTHDVTDDDRRFARDWAEHIISAPDTSLPMETAAARVILHAVPAAPRPTLADMAPDERRACQRMQADTKRGRAIITTVEWVDGHAELIDRQGDVFCEAHTDVTPRPDLPRFVWPGDTPAPALPEGWRLADHPEHGRVIVANAIPGRDGHIHYVFSSDRYPTGLDWHHCTPDALTYLDQEADQ